MLSEEEYKLAKEHFVSGAVGSSLSDVFFLVSIAPAMYFVRSAFCRFMGKWKFKPSSGVLVTVDFLVLVFSIVLATTLAADNAPEILAASLVVAFAFLLSFAQPSSNSQNRLLQDLEGPKKTFVTQYRTSLMIGTCVSILAVDFSIYPRRFVKTETYGTSLMDTGVGCFVFSHALVSTRNPARFKQGQASQRFSRFAWNTLVSVLPTLALGVTRTITNKAANYQEHVSEYGAHWNFFFTLSAVALCAKLLSFVFLRKIPVPAQRSGCWSSSRRRARGLFGVLVLLAYECLLRHGLEDYIMNAPRVDLISANKEGICSSVGYLALYLLAAELGSWLMWSNPDFRKDPDRNLRQWTKKVVLLALFGLVAIAATYCLHTSGIGRVSRRIANASYVLWTMGLNSVILSFFLAAHVLSGSIDSFPSELVEAVNLHSLLFFVVANLLTGVINLSIRTLYVPPWESLCIISCYIAFVCAGVFCLFRHSATLQNSAEFSR